MIPVSELQSENKQIDDLRAILSVLIANADLRDNEVFCELLDRFRTKLENHLNHESRALYPEMLSHRDHDINQVAASFVDNTHELERILHGYTKRWCKNYRSGDRELFVNETQEIFRLVDERLNMETTRLFPALTEPAAHH
jgi:hemerythrin-like domain-containing protein